MNNPLNLKVGDFVQIDESTSLSSFNGTTILEVVEIDKNDPHCTYKLKAPDQTDGWWVLNTSILKRIDKNNGEMKVGDKVRLTDRFIAENRDYPWVQRYIGKTMTIKSIYGDDVFIKENGCVFAPGWLELVDKSVNTTPKKTAAGIDLFHKKRNPITINLMNNHKLLTNIKLK